MNNPANRRQFLKTAALASAAVTLPRPLAFPSSKSLLVFTKSSGFEHAVVKRSDGKLSIVETTVTELGKKHGFQVQCSKDGRIFDSSELHSFQGVLFFTTGDLTQSGTDKNPPMSAQGKQTFLEAVRGGLLRDLLADIEKRLDVASTKPLVVRHRQNHSDVAVLPANYDGLALCLVEDCPQAILGFSRGYRFHDRF